MTIYHVTREWDGGDLKSLAQRIDDGEMGTLDEALEAIDAKWGLGGVRAAERYIDEDGRQIHFHATLAEAIDYRDEWCADGGILAVEAGDLDLSVGLEYPHPACDGPVPAELVRVVEMATV